MPTVALPRRVLVTVCSSFVVLALLASCTEDTDEGSSPSSVRAPVTLPDRLEPTTSVPPHGAEPSTTPTTTDAGTAGVVVEPNSFRVRAPLECDAPTHDATVEWVAQGATAATILVDSTEVADRVPVTGSFDLTLPCDGVAHTVLLVLSDGVGAPVTLTQAVLAAPRG